MIARTWRGAVRTEDAEAYLRYLGEVAQPGILGLAGNHGFAMLTRPDGDRTVIVTVSLWETLESIEAFAGQDISRAVFYPKDDDFLVQRDLHVDHWQVADGSTVRWQ